MINRIVAWSKSQATVQAIIIVGSRARETDDIDHFSDLDLILFSDSPSELVSSETWISTISRPWILDFSQTFAGDAEWQVIFEGGFKVDFIITSSGSPGVFTQVFEGSPYQEVFNQGWKHLYLDPNKTTEISPLAGTLTMSPPRPTSARTQLSHALFVSYGLAKSIFRSDLWRAHNYLCQLRAQIMWFIDLQARFNSTGKVSIWKDGRCIEQWASQELIKRLPMLFPGYNRESLARSFHCALELLDELALDVSFKAGEDHPTPGQQATSNWFKQVIIL